jgi:hypothetical protein
VRTADGVPPLPLGLKRDLLHKLVEQTWTLLEEADPSDGNGSRSMIAQCIPFEHALNGGDPIDITPKGHTVLWPLPWFLATESLP